MRFSMKMACGFLASVLLFPTISFAQLPDCSATGIPDFATLKADLQAVVNGQNGGFGFPMWATIVNRKGEVCLVTRSSGPSDEWPGSRVISAQKANTANAFGLPIFSLATANLYTAVQPGGSLFGLQESNPVNPAVAYAGDSNDYGTTTDPMATAHVKVGGVNVFGGGLALYNASGTLVGGLGVSGDSSCADHVIAWRLRNMLGLDYVPAGVNTNTDPTHPDNIIYDIDQPGNSRAIAPSSPSGWGHPHCAPTDVAPSSLPPTHHP
jgi:uncharacterized protein GlcG (DUF336 family)